MYQMKFVFLDGGHIIIGIAENRVDDFFKNLNQSRIFWIDDELENGFWLPLDKIRYITFKRDNETTANESAEKVLISDGKN